MKIGSRLWLAAFLAVAGPAWAQQATPAPLPGQPAPAESPEQQAARMRAGLMLLNDEKTAAENRAMASAEENESLRAQIARAQSELKEMADKLKETTTELEALKTATAGSKIVPDKKP